MRYPWNIYDLSHNNIRYPILSRAWKAKTPGIIERLRGYIE